MELHFRIFKHLIAFDELSARINTSFSFLLSPLYLYRSVFLYQKDRVNAIERYHFIYYYRREEKWMALSTVDFDDYAEQGPIISRFNSKRMKRYQENLSTDFHFSPSVAFEANQLKILNGKMCTEIQPLI